MSFDNSTVKLFILNLIHMYFTIPWMCDMRILTSIIILVIFSLHFELNLAVHVCMVHGEIYVEKT